MTRSFPSTEEWAAHAPQDPEGGTPPQQYGKERSALQERGKGCPRNGSLRRESYATSEERKQRTP